MNTMDLSRWTTDELLAEALSRSAGDRPALDRIQITIMRALLDDCDRRSAVDRNTPSGHWHATEAALV